MSEKKFLLLMDTKKTCLLSNKRCFFLVSELCAGDLSNRPAWCPLEDKIDLDSQQKGLGDEENKI